MASFDTEKFINQIKRRPAIYDINCLQYNDRTAKMNAWFEVCQAMIEDWDALSDEDRAAEEKALRNKWRNIRDYFMKEVKMQNSKKGRAGRKRKKSAHYNHLQFLLPMSTKKRGTNKQQNKTASKPVEPCKDEVVLTDEIEIVTTPGIEEYNLPGVLMRGNQSEEDPYQQQQHQTVVCEASMASFDNEMPVDVLSGGNGQRQFQSPDDDYDKMFLLSLLPSLRQIPEHMKLHVRIQMQQILASAFHSSNHHAG